MPEVEIFEFVHEINVCYLEKFKEQEFEEKKNVIIFHYLVMWLSRNGTLGKTTATLYIM